MMRVTVTLDNGAVDTWTTTPEGVQTLIHNMAYGNSGIAAVAAEKMEPRP